MLVINTSLCYCRQYMKYSYVETLSFFMGYPEQVVGGHYYFPCITVSRGWLPLYIMQSEDSLFRGPLRLCMLTISTTSWQGASKEMHRGFITASHHLFLTSQVHTCVSNIVHTTHMHHLNRSAHLALGIFTKMLTLLVAVCCNLDLKLALNVNDASFRSKP